MSKKMTSLGNKFIRTGDAVSSKYKGLSKAVAAEYQLTVCEMDILMCLDRCKTPQTVRDVSHDTHYSKGMISRCVESLRQSGYVTVERDTVDRRAVRISTTEKAKPAIVLFHDQANGFIEALYAGLNETDIQTLDQLMETVLANIEDM